MNLTVTRPRQRSHRQPEDETVSLKLETGPLVMTEGLDMCRPRGLDPVSTSPSRLRSRARLGNEDSERSPGNVPERAYRALSCTRTQNESETTRSESFPLQRTETRSSIKDRLR